jgi:hypothetical protein
MCVQNGMSDSMQRQLATAPPNNGVIYYDYAFAFTSNEYLV